MKQLNHNYQKDLSYQILGAAIEVHKNLGPGLLESTYETCLMCELSAQGIKYESQYPLTIKYKHQELDCHYRLDLVAENQIIIEIKSVEKLLPIHQAQLLTYMKLSSINIGLLINFNEIILKNGVKRLILG